MISPRVVFVVLAHSWRFWALLVLVALLGAGCGTGPADFTTSRGTTFHLGSRAGELWPDEANEQETALERGLAQYDGRYAAEGIARCLQQTEVLFESPPDCATCAGKSFAYKRGSGLPGDQNYWGPTEFRATIWLKVPAALRHEELHVLQRCLLDLTDPRHERPEWVLAQWNGGGTGN